MKDNKIGKYRWIIVALLFFSTTTNYLDRQVIGYLKPLFSKPLSEGGLNWTSTDFATVTSCFTALYAVTTIFAGWVMDKIGTKLGLAISLVIWSVFGMANAFCGASVFNHAVIRSLFGIGEAGNFPASIKTVAEWFPKKERALATGIFNSGSNIGAMLASITVPIIAYDTWFGGAIKGWEMAYLLTGAIGLFWLIFWFMIYDIPSKNKKLSAAEFNYIHSDDVAIAEIDSISSGVEIKASWSQLLKYPQTWAFFFGKFMTDGIWFFLLFWLPDYMKKQFHMEGHAIMFPLFTVYGIAIVGSISGGSLPIYFINRGMEAYKARMTAMLLIAILPLCLLSTQYFGNIAHFGDKAYLYALAVICVGAAAHQAWSTNLFTTVSDMFPKKVIGSVIGIGCLAGGIGGVMVQQLVGRLSDYYERIHQIEVAYSIMFALSASMYLLAWGVMKLLVPRYSPITDL